MSKVDISIQFFGDTLMARKLFAIIRRDRMGSDRQRLHEVDNSIRHDLSGLALDLSQQCPAPSCYVACPALDEALCIDEETGVRYADPSYCTVYDECYYAYPFEPKRVHRYERDNKAYKCDLCMG